MICLRSPEIRLYFIFHEMVDRFRLQSEISKDLLSSMPIEAFLPKADLSDLLIKNTVGVKCKNCGSENVNAYSKQVRSGDEATTVFYTCLDCKNKWRVG